MKTSLIKLSMLLALVTAASFVFPGKVYAEGPQASCTLDISSTASAFAWDFHVIVATDVAATSTNYNLVFGDGSPSVSSTIIGNRIDRIETHTYNSSGTYVVFLHGEINGTSVGKITCDVSKNLTVSGTAVGLVYINAQTSNGSPVTTCWVLSGPSPKGPDCGSSNGGGYASDQGIYSVTADDLAGYTKSISPTSATLLSGSQINFVITYTPIIIPTLGVTVTANPNSGPSPLPSTITATVTGTAIGNITYNFYCTGLEATPVTTIITTKPTRSFTCNYASGGTYNPRIVILRSGLTAQASTTVTVSSEAAFVNVTLVANPNQGTAPLTSTLTARVTRNTTDTMFYYFYCTGLESTYSYRQSTPQLSVSTNCTYTAAGIYRPRVEVFSQGQVWVASTTVLVDVSLLASPTPTISNATCGYIKFTWPDINGEDGYTVWRASNGGAGSPPYSSPKWTNITALGTPTSLPANSTSWQYRAGAGTYYYILKAYKNLPAAESNSIEKPLAILPCAANLSSSSVGIYEYKRAGLVKPYSAGVALRNGDIVTFRILIPNASGAAAATISSPIVNSLSSNFTMPTTGWNLRVNKDSDTIYNESAANETGGSVSSALPKVNIIRSGGWGAKPGDAKSWEFLFDAQISAGVDPVQMLTNTVTINYTDGVGSNVITKSFNVLLSNNEPRGPDFYEVGP